MASKEATVWFKVDMSDELRRAFESLSEGMAAVTAALAKATPPTAYDMLPGGLKAATAVPRHYPSIRCPVYDCYLPEHYVGGIPPEKPAGAAKGSDLSIGANGALYVLLVVLDGWIEGARSNHDALGHRGEPRGEECWRQFAPEDIRRMVNDACREVGISEFPYPKVPKEDAL